MYLYMSSTDFTSVCHSYSISIINSTMYVDVDDVWMRFGKGAESERLMLNTRRKERERERAKGKAIQNRSQNGARHIDMDRATEKESIDRIVDDKGILFSFFLL